MPFLNQRKGENDRRKYFMINPRERMLLTSAGFEPVTSWSPVGRRIQLSHRDRLTYMYVVELFFFCGGGGGGVGVGRGSLRPFKEYFTYIELTVHQTWAKTGVPGVKPPEYVVGTHGYQ